jgi:ParB family chromosome partitioning protein
LVRQSVEARPTRAIRKTEEGDANIRAAESKLRRKFGTQVRIVQSKGVETGKIELEFYNQGDLDRLYRLLITDVV